ncbi:hypothetical protein SAMN06265348_102322 [Pedobacter westerhofensis]|uniref:Uncharacterized protein n=1 Tax=Pedobacter westerhofensis TaxID=425512 RepID=A0A521BIE3_9SPHI|nr:hypothetical protein [Pedobacter westerhofensis]SMO46908.1 hypothetical protein SAMN06265348_102322 [Pedobacter westerhofensis]
MNFRTLFLMAVLVASITCSQAQVKLDARLFKNNGEAKVTRENQLVEITWPTGNAQFGKVQFDLSSAAPLFRRISLGTKTESVTVSEGLDPVFLLSIGRRDLVSQNGWNIFFDKVPLKPFKMFPVVLKKDSISVESTGSRTVVRIGKLTADHFTGVLEVTFYNGSPLINIAAVMSTQADATAIVYDAGLVSKVQKWEQLSWINTEDSLMSSAVKYTDSAHNLAVKYRSIAVQGKTGSIAVFPAPHQYFYPLDEAFNLRFIWSGKNYRNSVPEYGIGIRQELQGDQRYVPWFNAPPGTQQRLNFFCLLSRKDNADALNAVKKFTNADRYAAIPGFKTMSSHFHNEFIMKVVLANQPVPDKPEFVEVFKRMGVDIVHLGEFHYTAHPQGPDSLRLNELKALFEQCRRLSGSDFLLLPGEEPNEFFGGHWLQIFPKPVYWVMSRSSSQPFVEQKPGFGKVYHVGDKTEMLKLLQEEQGLAWTAHARTKGSVNTPDAYAHEDFFKSDRFMGAAWKAMPADLSQPRLGKRVLDLMDDMNNWGEKKTVIAEADLFSITRQNEMYAHMNVNYMMLDRLPKYDNGWKALLKTMQQGKFFSTTGEVLIHELKVNGKLSGESVLLNTAGTADVRLKLSWTFPLNFIELISGDGKKVYREKIDLRYTKAYGTEQFKFQSRLKGRKWMRIEVWDAAVNGAFSQTFYLK